MGYQYDIFISYRRNAETLRWIRKHFLPLLDLHVGHELTYKPSIFLDMNTESGASWPLAIGRALGASRILIALWSADYLCSSWCAHELSHMVAREQQANLRTAQRPSGLIVPAFIHDGEQFPRELRHIQHFEIKSCFNVRMACRSPRAEELDTILTHQAPAIANCIANAPPWRKDWPAEAARELFATFNRTAAQKKVPGKS